MLVHTGGVSRFSIQQLFVRRRRKRVQRPSCGRRRRRLGPARAVVGLALLLAGAPGAVHGEEDQGADVRVADEADPGAAAGAGTDLLRQMADQKQIDPRACGPCAVYHSLLFGRGRAGEVAQALPGRTAAERVRHLLDTYGSLPSTVRPNHSMQNHRGMHWQDVAVFMNAILADHGGPVVTGGYLNRGRDEPQLDHLRRVHGLLSTSLDAGWPPVVAVRSYVADINPNRGVVEWRTGESHYLAVTEIGALAEAGDGGFPFRYADSFRVGVHQGFIHIERQRDFEAQTTVDAIGRWVDDYPFLTVTAPFLRMVELDVPLHLRTVVTLHHAVVHLPQAGATTPADQP